MEIGASASSIFGNPSGASIFSVGETGGATPAQEAARATIHAHRREINRIRGYKLELSPAENQQLSKLQVRIQEIEARASAGTARPDELEERKELFQEADRIIGKPIVDADADEVLAELASGIETLLQPTLAKPVAKRVETLQKLSDRLEEKLATNPENRTALQQFQNVTRVIAQLKPQRAVSELSKAEASNYDDLVELVNARAGAKVELNAKEATRVAELQRSITDLQSALPADASQQPTPAAVSRAYARLSFG